MRMINRFKTSLQFVRFVIRHFIEDDCAYIASALAFTSLLAVVPLMSVGLAVLSTFPVFQKLADPIQNFIFEHFIPATGTVIQSYLQQFAAQVSNLSLWGVIFLLISALLVMFTIEQAMNKIWRVTTSRQGIPAFLLYWSILSLAPIMIGLSIAASSYLFSMPMWMSDHMPATPWHWSPFLLSLAGFIFLYMVVPNCKVRFSHALIGGLFAAVFFECAKQGFAYYLTRFDTYELLYGAFAAVPILFIWVYWVWMITLLGAEITYALAVDHQRRPGKAIDGLTLALMWLHELSLIQQQGAGLSFQELVRSVNHPFAVAAEEVLHDLLAAGFIHYTADNQYMLSRELHHIALYDLIHKLPYPLPEPGTVKEGKNGWLQHWQELLLKNEQQNKRLFHMNLEHLFQS